MNGCSCCSVTCQCMLYQSHLMYGIETYRVNHLSFSSPSWKAYPPSCRILSKICPRQLLQSSGITTGITLTSMTMVVSSRSICGHSV
jgi:hypothetical protein